MRDKEDCSLSSVSQIFDRLGMFRYLCSSDSDTALGRMVTSLIGLALSAASRIDPTSCGASDTSPCSVVCKWHWRHASNSSSCFRGYREISMRCAMRRRNLQICMRSTALSNVKWVKMRDQRGLGLAGGVGFLTTSVLTATAAPIL